MSGRSIWIVMSLLAISGCSLFEVVDFKPPNRYEGCCSIAAVEDTIGHTLVSIPNAITPNADGLNDAFSIYSSDLLQITSLQIMEQNELLAIDRSNIPVKRGWNMVWTPKNSSNKVIQGLYHYTMTLKDNQGMEKTVVGQFCAFLCGEDQSETIPQSDCHFSTQVNESGHFDLNLPGEDDCN